MAVRWPQTVFGFALLLGSCAVPPPDAYVATKQSNGRAAGIDLGKDAAGEACEQVQTSRTSANVYCGTWQQPSGKVRAAGPASPSALAGLATGSPWRAEIDARFACGEPQRTTILGDVPAVLMQCSRRIGNWPHVAMVASVNGQGWFADGVLPASPAVERAVGVLSGRLPAAAAAHTAASDALLAGRLAAQAFSSGDIGAYEDLMAAGTAANQAEDFAAAEKAYRGALALQQKQGADNPGTSLPMALLALQLSNQGSDAEADALLARAQVIAARSSEPEILANLLFTRAQVARSRGQLEAALTLLQQAEKTFASQLAPAVLNAKPRPGHAGFLARGSAGTGDLLPNRELLADAASRNAILGVVEARRYQAIVLRQMGRTADADAKLQSAATLAGGNNLRVAVLDARLTRTEAQQAASLKENDLAAAGFDRASTVFGAALPESRPVAETRLLLAAQLNGSGDHAGAVRACQTATLLLRARKIGVAPKLLQPCLDVLAAAAGEATDEAARQSLLTQMFEAAQLAQGSVTSQQIAQATVRLGENASDPRVADAMRAKTDTEEALAALYRQRDQAAQARAAGDQPAAPTAPDLDARIAKAQSAEAEAEAALQAAAPNYGQLVQEVAPAHDVLAALAKGEAFVAVDLAPSSGWTFLLRDGKIGVARIDGGETAMAGLVKKVRATIEQSPPAPFDTAASQEIYSRVFGKLAGQLDGVSGLVVAPTESLLSLPFGILLTGPAEPGNLPAAPWLLRRMTVAHVPAAANFVSLRKIAGTTRATRPWFGFGDFRPVTLAQAQHSFPPATCGDNAALFAGLPPLPSAVRELGAARALMGAAAEDELTGPAFTAPAVLKASLSDMRVLHFATHALLPTDLHCQSEPAIVTSAPADAPDAAGALLTASQISSSMKLDADAVILSACNTGGPAGGEAGQSLSGLARSFFYAGARALVVTHWEADDGAAAFLVARTLQFLRDGSAGGAAGALRAAQLDLLDRAGKTVPAEFAHPYYWGVFALIGEGGGTKKPAVTASAAAGAAKL